MLHGSPAVASFMQATAGYEIILEVGVSTIREYSIKMTERLRTNLLAAGFTINSPRKPEKRGGTITVGLNADENGPAYVKALDARGILVDHRPEAGIRVSPHFYTLEDELDEFVEIMSELREKRRWREHVTATSAY
jgi:kynureninase